MKQSVDAAAPLAVDEGFTVRVCQDLVRIDCVNPLLVPGAPGEREIGGYTADALAALGLEVRTHEPEPGRISVTGRLRGSGGGRSLMLNAHYDTVGVEDKYPDSAIFGWKFAPGGMRPNQCASRLVG